jgi:hypothetical protein
MVIDYDALAAWVGILAGPIAITGLVLEARRHRLALQTDLLMRLDARLGSVEVRSWRREAARKLIAGERANYELDDVLDFLGTISFLYERRAIDKDLAYRQFSWWLIRYWLCGREWVAEGRKEDPLWCDTLERVANKLMEVERRRGYPPYSEDMLRSFLQDEARLGGAAA